MLAKTILTVALLFIGLIWTPLSIVAAEKYALLAGVTRYKNGKLNDPPLAYPEADASAVGALLKQSGYTVEILLGKQATLAGMKAALQRLRREGAADGVVLVGLFGHGVEYDREAYFCPWDAELRFVKLSNGDLSRDKQGRPRVEPDPASLVSMRSVLDAFETCNTSNCVLLADCCRNDPSATRGRAFGSSYTTEKLGRGTVALFACSANEQAYEDKDWGHGAFTRAFLDAVPKLASRGRVTTGRLADSLVFDVRDLVRAKNATQTVHQISSGTVDLKIKPGSAPGKAITNSLGMKLAFIPAGEFLMGSPASEKDRYYNETQHRVKITKPFYLGVHEVTQGEWKAIMGDEPWKGEDYVKEGSSYPATHVSWEDAVKFCAALTKRERDAGRITAAQSYRLPTEAEWEYACRAGSTTAYSFGDDASKLGEYAWYDKNASYADELYAHQVGLKKPNSWGLYDMHGNVWEWCSDWHGDYPKTSVTDPQGSGTGSDRVDRGGGWADAPQDARSANRNGSTPGNRIIFLGFRLAFSPAGPGR